MYADSEDIQKFCHSEERSDEESAFDLSS